MYSISIIRINKGRVKKRKCLTHWHWHSYIIYGNHFQEATRRFISLLLNTFFTCPVGCNDPTLAQNNTLIGNKYWLSDILFNEPSSYQIYENYGSFILEIYFLRHDFLCVRGCIVMFSKSCRWWIPQYHFEIS